MCNIFSDNLLLKMGNLSTLVGLILKIRIITNASMVFSQKQAKTLFWFGLFTISSELLSACMYFG